MTNVWPANDEPSRLRVGEPAGEPRLRRRASPSAPGAWRGRKHEREGRITIVDQTKFVIGIVFALIGVALLVTTRRTRGFGQRKQAGLLFIIGAAIFLAIGLGYLDL
jgi:hypothetical protein